jgi:hypothetical protein
MILQNHFYYGSFEYPKNSGNWYQGKHEPIITKELFDLVQSQMKSQVLRVEDKEFAFTKLMTCGLCGSGVTAQEKFKKLKDGTVNRHVYYGCTKARDKNCKCGYLNEIELVKRLEAIISDIDLNEIKVQERILRELRRFKKFQRSLLGISSQINVSEVDIRDYARFILREGEDSEKRELLSCLKSQVSLKEGVISLVAK